MPLYIGEDKIKSIYVGEQKIKKAYIGEKLIFQGENKVKFPSGYTGVEYNRSLVANMYNIYQACSNICKVYTDTQIAIDAYTESLPTNKWSVTATNANRYRSNVICQVGDYVSSGYSSLYVFFYHSGILIFVETYSGSGTTQMSLTAVPNISVGQWYHIEIDVSNKTVKINDTVYAFPVPSNGIKTLSGKNVYTGQSSIGVYSSAGSAYNSDYRIGHIVVNSALQASSSVYLADAYSCIRSSGDTVGWYNFKTNTFIAPYKNNTIQTVQWAAGPTS